MKKQSTVLRTAIGIVGVLLIAFLVWSMVDTLARDSSDAEAHFNTGLAHLETAYEKGGAYAPEGIAALQDAISEFTQAIELDHDYAVAYYDRGLAAIELVHFYYRPFSQETEELFSGAVDDFETAIDLDSTLYLAYAGLGNAYDRYGEFEDAVDWYDKALDHETEILEHWGEEALANIFYSRGRAYQRVEDYRAIDDYETALEWSPNHDYTLSHLAAVYVVLGEYEDAIDMYNQSVAVKESKPALGMWDYHSWEGRGLCYYYMGEYDEAIQDFEEALDIAYWPLPDAYLGLGMTYLKVGDEAKGDENLDTAIALCTQTIEDAQAPGEVFAEYNTRGLAYVGLGQYDAAILDFQKVIEFGPPFVYGHVYYEVEGHKNIGIAYSGMGDNDQAEQYYQEALSMAEARELNFSKIEIEELLSGL
ncbi:MAG: tetratricopeptide repeat protein [Chloroflexota bacterium]|nr:tetratricopeptide repeat protein [Chloroflexota bacterium]